VTLTTEVSGFLIGTLYNAPDGNDSLVNGAYSVSLGNTGTVTLPAGGTITEGYITSNPTIQLTPASPDVASQKLVIKGGIEPGYSNTENGIEISYDNNTAIVTDTLTFYINSDTYAGQTLYWWIYPESAGIGDTEYGTVVLSGSSGSFSILIDSDDYEFTVRVSPEEDNYGPGVIGVETGLINADEPTFDVDYHLHLTTGNLSETSIILGTDNHNVRTTTDGGISMTTTRGTVLFGNTPDNPITGSTHFHIMKDDPNNVDLFFGDDYNYVKLPTTAGVEVGANGSVWEFGTDGSLTLPGAVVNSTVAKDGPAFPTTTGVVDGLSQDSALTGLTDATYGPFTRSGVTFSVTIFGGVINGFTNVSGTATVNNVLGTISSGDIGGTAGTTTTWTSPTDFPGYGGGPMGSGCVLTGPGSTTGRINIKLTDPEKQNEWVFLASGTQVTVTGTGIIPSPLTLDLTGVSGQDGDFYYQEFNTPGAIYQDSVSSIGSVSFTQGGTTITITVDSVVQATPVAIDLTRTVNKLADGAYTLADGVEGQVMYLVRQTGSSKNAIRVNVANARIDGGLETTIAYYPFENIPDVNMSTLIFTDGAWQASNGGWD
jgi:hypothetical protein